MLRVIVGPRRSGKTTKMRELIAADKKPATILAVAHSINQTRDKFRPELLEGLTVTISKDRWDGAKRVYIDDLELNEKRGNLNESIFRSAKEGEIDLTVSFSPTLVSMTWRHLPLWWVAWQTANEIIELPRLIPDEDLSYYKTAIPWYDYQTQILGNVLLKTKDGIFKLEKVNG